MENTKDKQRIYETIHNGTDRVHCKPISLTKLPRKYKLLPGRSNQNKNTDSQLKNCIAGSDVKVALTNVFVFGPERYLDHKLSGKVGKL